MPNSRFLMQSERYTFAELAKNSTLPLFASDRIPLADAEADRIRVPIEDREFHVTYYVVCRKENEHILNQLSGKYDNIETTS